MDVMNTVGFLAWVPLSGQGFLLAESLREEYLCNTYRGQEFKKRLLLLLKTILRLIAEVLAMKLSVDGKRPPYISSPSPVTLLAL